LKHYPIFIVGIPRSGTTWLLSLFEHHPQCRSLRAADLRLDVSYPTKETGIFLKISDGDEIVRRFESLPSDKVLVEKTPGHLLQVGRIKKLFPQSRIVLIKRNREDVIWSMLQKNDFWHGSPETLEAAVDLYNTYAQAQCAYNGFDAIVEYESLWEEPVNSLKALMDRLGLDPEPVACMVEMVQGGAALPEGLEGVYRTGVPGEGSKNLNCSQRKYIEKRAFSSERFLFRPSILFAVNHLLGWTGTETLLMTVIANLVERGIRVALFARHLNSEWVDSYFDPRIRITDDLETIRWMVFDVAHIHHSSALVEVRAAFPHLPLLFWSLGTIPFLEQPVTFDIGVSRYLAISDEVEINLVSKGVSKNRVSVLRNIVCETTFYPMSDIRSSAERVLVLSYKMDAERRERLRHASKLVGASIRFLGSTGQEIAQKSLCQAINEADLVVSIGRGAIEAMLCARVPLIFDIHGGDGLVTPDNFSDLITCNLSGRLTGHEYTSEDLANEMLKYRREYGDTLRKMAIEHFGANINIPRLLEFYLELEKHPVQFTLSAELKSSLELFYRLSAEDRRLFKQINSLHSWYEAELARVKTTLSWRFTAPMRLASNLFRRLVNSDNRRDGF
jgi:hypothetical protein